MVSVPPPFMPAGGYGDVPRTAAQGSLARARPARTRDPGPGGTRAIFLLATAQNDHKVSPDCDPVRLGTPHVMTAPARRRPARSPAPPAPPAWRDRHEDISCHLADRRYILNRVGP